MTEENNASNWFQDNLRIIISVGIVILLVFAIYSYSKRNSRTDVVVDDSQIEEIAMTAGESSNDEINEIIDEIRDDQEKTEEAEVVTNEIDASEITEAIAEEAEQAAKEEAERKAQEIAEKARVAAEQRAEQEQAEREAAAAEEARLAEEEKMAQEQAEREAAAAEETKRREEESQKAEDIVREVIESRSTQQQTQQKDGVVVVVAVHGDSMTTLARKAAKDYINRNNAGDLTPSHKIYIEDYLRKKQSSRNINVNTEMEFAEADIAEAIERSRALTDAQLNNLARYAKNVPTL